MTASQFRSLCNFFFILLLLIISVSVEIDARPFNIMKSENPAGRVIVHGFFDEWSLGSIKQSGPSPGVGHKYTDSKKTLGGLWKLRCVTGLDSTNSLGSIPQNDDEEPTRPSLFSTKPFPLRFYAPNHSPLPKSPTLRHRILHCVPEVTDYQRGNYDQHHRDREHNHHHHEHNHDHHNHYSNDGAELSGPKRVVVKFAKAIGCLPLLAAKARCKARTKRFHSGYFSSSWGKTKSSHNVLTKAGPEEIFTSVEELKENYPDSALVLNVNGDKLPNISNWSCQSVPVHNIKVDSYIFVGAGEVVPVDCEVFQGSATITTEQLTEEVNPFEAKVGDRVPGGARNLDGRMIIKVISWMF
ncbi:Heavy metal atpase 1 [Tripterygium wilfordii]|uniref:Heavy metal atpase 1 n=1 Tax=Tripterygium wilfordii TaxID=458696 RepID=A0A7J7CQF2_TRIWF|nr:Heavy metal atpase 1 [Tripterygium wilfordii]